MKLMIPLKAVLRGHIISDEVAERRKSKEKLTDIDKSDLEVLHKEGNKPETVQECF